MKTPMMDALRKIHRTTLAKGDAPEAVTVLTSEKLARRLVDECHALMPTFGALLKGEVDVKKPLLFMGMRVIVVELPE